MFRNTLFRKYLYLVDGRFNCLLGAVLVAVLRSHGEASAAVAPAGFRAIANLCAGNAANQTRLREAGICPGVSAGLAVVVSEMAFGLL